VFKSRKTFGEEFKSVQSIPRVFFDSEAEYGKVADPPFRSLQSQKIYSAPDTFSDADRSENHIEGTDYFFQAVPIERLYKAAQRSERKMADAILEELGIDFDSAVEIVGGEVRDANGAMNYDFGTEAFGTYLPWHAFVRSSRTPWGMYLFLDKLIHWAVRIHLFSASLPSPKPSVTAIFNLLFVAVVRHELFHFHVERFALRQEVIQRMPVYRPYVEQVKSQVRQTDRWLEEALAQAVVLESRRVSNKAGFDRETIKKILIPEFKKFPAGYGQFECESWGGPANAHRLFGSQIVTAQEHPGFIVTDLAVPKVEYQADVKVVPGYIAVNKRVFGQFQLATPKDRAFERWLRSERYPVDERAPGDHKTIYIGKQKVQLNYNNGHVDWASLKAVAKVIGVGPRDLILQINAC
jgi:hypothetical protein